MLFKIILLKYQLPCRRRSPKNDPLFFVSFIICVFKKLDQGLIGRERVQFAAAIMAMAKKGKGVVAKSR